MLLLPKTQTQQQLESYGFNLLPNYNNSIEQYFMNLHAGVSFLLLINKSMCSLYILAKKNETPVSKLMQVFTKDTLQKSLSHLLPA